MTALLCKPVTAVWAALMALTCTSTWLLSQGAFSPMAATVGTFLIAAIKGRLVILHFMELRDAPTAVRFLFEGAMVAITAVIIALY
ncbi:MAG TPA: cytochrome C oxidase subunit IV family protein [Streptomyces sp.]|nr:cytochrome C oxidase subunit IV family protein [Streptomyces sp.]